MTKTPTKNAVTILQFFPIAAKSDDDSANRSPVVEPGFTEEYAVADTPLALLTLSKRGEDSQDDVSQSYTIDPS